MTIRSIALALLAAVILGPGMLSAQPPATAPFDRTIIVGGADTDINNGNNLLIAINDAVAAGASSTDPWLVKVEPGIFDLGTQRLQMRNFVDIEGSGRNATFIRSAGSAFVRQPSTVLVGTGVDAELRHLTVQYVSDQQGGSAIANFSSELKLTQVNLEVDAVGDVLGFSSNGGSPRLSGVFPRVASRNGGRAAGMIIRNGGPIVNEMFIFIKNSTTRENDGIRLGRGADPVLEQISGVVTGGDENYGIFVDGGSGRITNNRWTVSGGDRAIGVLIRTNPIADELNRVEIKESTFEVSQGSIATVALTNDSASADVTVKDSRLVATPSAISLTGSVAARNTVPGAATAINQTVLRGSIALQNQVNGTLFEVGATLVAGTRSFAAGSTAVCAASYDAAYTPLPPGC